MEEGCGFTPDSLVKILTEAAIKLCFCTLCCLVTHNCGVNPRLRARFRRCHRGDGWLCTDWLFGLQFRIILGSNLTVSDTLDQFRARTFPTSHWARGTNSYWSGHESSIKVSFWTLNSAFCDFTSKDLFPCADGLFHDQTNRFWCFKREECLLYLYLVIVISFHFSEVASLNFSIFFPLALLLFHFDRFHMCIPRINL